MKCEVKYLSQDHLVGFENYKVSQKWNFISNIQKSSKKTEKYICLTHLNLILQYSSMDTSPLSVYVMHPFWNKVVQVKYSISSFLICKTADFEKKIFKNYKLELLSKI